MRKIAVILFSLIWSISSFGQLKKILVADTTMAPIYDTTYIKSFRDYLVVTLVSSANSNLLEVEDSLGNPVEFEANLPTSFGIGLDYKWFTAEISSSLGNLGDPKKGETKARSFSFGLTGRKIWFRNFYQQMQGYYLANPQIINPDFNPEVDRYPSRSDLKTTIYYASINYGFNYKRYSHMASMWQLERQRRPAGSFTLGLSYAYNAYDSDSSIVPSSIRDQFISDKFITGYYRNMIGVNIGYLYTLAFGIDGKFFISLAAIPGLSYQHEQAYFEDNEGRDTYSGIGAHAELRGSLGFNGDLWYTSASLAAYVIANSFEGKNPGTTGYGFGRFVVGYKFKLPKINSPFLNKIGL